MKRICLILLALMSMSALALVACDDEDTQQEANEQFCDDAAEMIASLRVIRDLDRNSTIDEVEDARERAQNAYASMIESAGGVVEAQLDDVESAYEELQRAVNEIDDDDAIGDALDAVDDELEALALATSQVLNDVDCSGVGDVESQSEE